LSTKQTPSHLKIPTLEPPITSAEKSGLTIIVPCFNEGAILPHLREMLDATKQHLGQKYEIHVILADDGSTDDTWSIMLELFASDPTCSLVRHTKNAGVAATILAGIRAAKTEIVCSIDCDCTYDPNELGRLVPRLISGVDLVTASPYHPLGRVRNVPRWRLLLSKTASMLYRRVLNHKLYTYTSCFRVYRRSAILNLNLRRPGFLGVAELIARLDLQGSVIVECPANLWARVQGTSKMKVARVAAGHLCFLAELMFLRGRKWIFDGRPTVLQPAELDKKRGAITPWVQP
jgi:glycosyltransferase involved in cell wall biosynthesis